MNHNYNNIGRGNFNRGRGNPNFDRGRGRGNINYRGSGRGNYNNPNVCHNFNNNYDIQSIHYQNVFHNANDGRNENENTYYETVSDDDDECFGENNHQKFRNNQILTNQSSSIDLDFDQLPFVPKFSSELRNTVEAAKNSVDNNTSKPPLVGDWGTHNAPATFYPNANSSSFQPASCPYFPETPIIKPVSVSDNTPTPITESKHNPLLTTHTENTSLEQQITPSSQINSVSSNYIATETCKIENHLPPPLTNLLSASASTSTSTAKVESKSVKENNSVNATANTVFNASWADENGDPIPGAFDDIEKSGAATATVTSDTCVNTVNSSKVEYVFHVKEKKDDVFSAENSSNSAVGSVSASTSTNEGIPQGNVISSLVNLVPNNPDSTLVTSQTLNCIDIQDNTGFSDTITSEYDQKTLYESSKNKQELCQITLQDGNEATASGINKGVWPKKKTDLFAFRRNDFINKKKEEGQIMADLVAVENDASKSNDEKTLESQALNELLKEVKLGAERARNYGALGWQKQPIPVVNKRFLKNTLVSTLRQPYKPPTRGGRLNKGLHDDRHSNRDDDSDSSSYSGSSRSSRSTSGSSRSYSYSSSSSSSSRGSRSRSRSRRHKHGKKGKDKQLAPPWQGGGPPPPPNAYFDWAAAYGYPWYDPNAAAAMYYGMGDGGGYPQMYSNDPQFWAAYRDYYGIAGGGRGGFNPEMGGGFRGGRGFGPRGRGGWRGRGRGGGGMMEHDGRDTGPRGEERFSDEDDYHRRDSLSRSRSRSRSHESQNRSNKGYEKIESDDDVNKSPGSTSTKGKRKRSSVSEERSVDRKRSKEKSGSGKSHGGKDGDREKREGSCSSKSKNSSGGKKKSSSKKRRHESDKKGDGEESEVKEGRSDKKKKKSKHKKKKKSKKGEKEDSDTKKDAATPSEVKTDDADVKDGENSEKTDEKNEKVLDVSEKSSVKVVSEKTSVKALEDGEKSSETKVTKKKTKSSVKKKADGQDDDGKKKKKTKKKGEVGFKGKKSKETSKDGKNTVDAVVDGDDGKKNEKSMVDVSSDYSCRKEEFVENKREEEFGKERKDADNTSKRRREEEIEKEIGIYRSRRERDRDDYEERKYDKEESRRSDMSIDDRDRNRRERYDDYEERRYIKVKGDFRRSDMVNDDNKYRNRGETRSDSSNSGYRRNENVDREKTKKRGGKIEEIERRLQERKAKRCNDMESETRQRTEGNKFSDSQSQADTKGKMAKAVTCDATEYDNISREKDSVNTNDINKDSVVENKMRKDSSQPKPNIKKNKKVSNEEGGGERVKKKKIVKKKVNKLKGENNDNLAENGVPTPVKKKKKVLKRKTDNGDGLGESKKKKIKKIKKNESSTAASDKVTISSIKEISQSTGVEKGASCDNMQDTSSDDHQKELTSDKSLEVLTSVTGDGAGNNTKTDTLDDNKS